MTSSKPYLVRALYQWILDNDTTPYILVDTSAEDLLIPKGIANDGKVVLNLAPAAIQDLEISNESIRFSARFGGVAQQVSCPMGSLLAIYARENGEGMMFPVDDLETGQEGTETPPRGGAPNLKVIK